MPTYVITEKAGAIVAGQRNSGVGTTLELTEQQAKAGLREGTLLLRKDAAEVKEDGGADESKKDAKKAPSKDDSKGDGK